jgi:ABC-type phosphonate transport system ATPase subunit
MASVVDRPKESDQSDLLGIEKYTEGLIRFIDTSATPITIGIQGEWGSGKTSLLNTIREELCERENAKYHSIWLNTWEYSLLSSPDETLIKIISGLVIQIGSMKDEKISEKSKKAFGVLGAFAKKFGGEVGGISGKLIEMAGEMAESTVSTPQDNSIKALRNALQEVINEALEEHQKKAFIFFVDDLDRLDPAVAVQILELIKNLFDLKNCIFILAIDYSVVVKGLQSKFGVMTEENEWEFRAFFDKIIQLPFSMPISSYDISTYLKKLLVDVNYFKKLDLENADTLQKIVEIVGYSVGTNPRALVRLTNSVSLIEIIRGNEQIKLDDRIIEFALVCMQIAYPIIYGLAQKDPNFTEWDEQFVYEVLKNKKVDESDLKLLENTDEFDDEWEQNLWKICQINNFLKQRVYHLSKLLNFIAENTPTKSDEKLGDAIDRLLRMSAFTSVSADGVIGERKTRVPKKRLFFDNAMESFIEERLNKEFAQFIGNQVVSHPKTISRKDSGNLFFSIKTEKLDFDFSIWTDYNRILTYVNNRNANASHRKNTINWFNTYLHESFPNMKFNDISKTKKRIVVLEELKIENLASREEFLEKYKETIEKNLALFLPSINQYKNNG